MRSILCVIMLFALASGLQAEWEQQKLDIFLSFDRHATATDASYRVYNTDIRGLWIDKGEEDTWSFSVTSSYNKVEDRPTPIRDLLTTELKWVQNDKEKRFCPTFTVSTRGDHGIHELFTLFAVGARHNFNATNWVELNGGLSKDVKDDKDSWEPDIGIGFHFQKKWGRLQIEVKPYAGWISTAAATGELRIRNGQRHLIYDQQISYYLSSHIYLTWHFEYDDWLEHEEKHSSVGIQYKW